MSSAVNNSEILSWILWNLEEEDGAVTPVTDIFQKYTAYCKEKDIVAATKQALGKTVWMVFPVVRTIERNGSLVYLNLRWRNVQGTQVCLPEYCSRSDLDNGTLEVEVPTQHMKNDEIVVFKLRFHENEVTVMYNDGTVPMEKLGLCRQGTYAEPFVSALLSAINVIKICKGAQPSNDSATSKKAIVEKWREVTKEEYQVRIKSPSCNKFINFLSKSDTCEACRNLMKRKRKANDPADSDCHPKKNRIPVCDKENAPAADDPFIAKLQAMFPDAPDNFLKLLMNQKSNRYIKEPRQRRWDPEIIGICLSLWNRSPKGYSMLKDTDILTLPSDRLLRYYKNCVRQKPGLIQENLEWMREEAIRKKLPDAGFHGGLLLDEMTIQDDLQLEKSGDHWTILGGIDLGDFCNDLRVISEGEQSLKMATHALQFLFVGFSGFRWPVAYYATKSLDACELAAMTFEILRDLDELGFTIDYVMGDGAAVNRGFFNLLCNGNARQANYKYLDMFDRTHEIALAQDPKHVIKKIRNGVEKSRADHTGKKKKLKNGNHFILWDHWENAHAYNNSLGLRKHRKLTQDHIYLTSELKMRNHLAEEVLNRDMLLLMKSYQKSLPEHQQDTLSGTIEFLHHTSEIISVFLNVNSPITSSTDPKLQTAKASLQYFLNWESSVEITKHAQSLLSREVREDLHSCVLSLETVSLKCLSLGCPLKPGVFNSDIIENFFCQQRGIVHGLNTNPTISQYGPGVNSIILGQHSVSQKSNAYASSAPALSMRVNKPNIALNKSRTVKKKKPLRI